MFLDYQIQTNAKRLQTDTKTTEKLRKEDTRDFKSVKKPESC